MLAVAAKFPKEFKPNCQGLSKCTCVQIFETTQLVLGPLTKGQLSKAPWTQQTPSPAIILMPWRNQLFWNSGSIAGAPSPSESLTVNSNFPSGRSSKFLSPPGTPLMLEVRTRSHYRITTMLTCPPLWKNQTAKLAVWVGKLIFSLPE